MLRGQGVATLLEQITTGEMLAQRFLSRAHGERQLTDLRHVGQLLHSQATSAQLGTSALAEWLRTRIREADQGTASEERSRRLETDAEAVQVLTVHRSKGLEFPIVYCPDLWISISSTDAIPVYHDPAAGNVRTIDVGGSPLAGFQQHKKLADAEQRGEDLRLAYVALTRARHQAVVWWASSWDSRDSALGRLLFGRDDEGNVALQLPVPPEESEVVARFEELAIAAPGCIQVERTRAVPQRRWVSPERPPAALAVRPFDRPLDRFWRRTSYTGITSRAPHPVVGSEPEHAGRSDEELPVLPTGVAGPTDVDESMLARRALSARRHARRDAGGVVHPRRPGVGRLRRRRSRRGTGNLDRSPAGTPSSRPG